MADQWTAEQLAALPDDGQPRELVFGEVRTLTPPGFRHQGITMSLARRLARFAETRGLGEASAAETGFLLSRDPDTVRAPDAWFLRVGRIGEPRPIGFFPGAPDLVVEVLSPHDRFAAVEEKVRCWLDHGATLVWVINPDARTVTAYRGTNDVRILSADDQLVAEDLLPGFRCPVGGLFRD